MIELIFYPPIVALSLLVTFFALIFYTKISSNPLRVPVALSFGVLITVTYFYGIVIFM